MHLTVKAKMKHTLKMLKADLEMISYPEFAFLILTQQIKHLESSSQSNSYLKEPPKEP
jgi:hypothetical protein